MLIVLTAAAGAAVWLYDALQPLAKRGEGQKFTVRYESPMRLPDILDDLEKRGVLRNSLATRILALLERRPSIVTAGSYSFGSAMNAEEILRQLRKPIFVLIHLPETYWASRTAILLQKHDIVDADEYMELVRNPGQFSDVVDFPLPKDSLEGYLYPKKYELPPLYGARRVIQEQLKEFERSVWNGPERPKNMKWILTLASLVQLEAGTDEDRAMIAGVIDNRIKKKMPLQIDSTILYALQKWRRLTFKDYRNVKSPYNTYTNKGLPPGPICSPDVKDIEAAMHPAKHNYLYYVALPNGHSIFAATYKDHLKNIAKRKAALKELKR